ncbi:hypothetical protein ACLI1C_02360 [Devosia sp. XGJD_8]|uniref:hypothetical protein n=1 Tax=Devosia sp. XGJD_8 TaxID=3391187 RepID=UPI0039853B0E
MTNGFKVILLLLVLGIVPALLPMPSLLATICMSPLLLVIPTGIGLATMSGMGNLAARGIDKLQALMIAYFLGLFTFITTFMLLERFSGMAAFLLVALVALTLLSVAGWLKSAEWIRLSDRQRSTLLLVVLVVVLLVAARYTYGLAIYSEYPVTDLFQRSHFQGGALEFAHTLVLNPFVAQSYIPFQQLFLGIATTLTGADPLDAEWIWPIAMAPLQAGAVLCVVRRLTLDRTAALFAMALVLSQYGLSNPTNGTLAETAVLVLLSLLLPTHFSKLTRTSFPWVKIAGLVFGVLLGSLANILSIEYAAALVALVILSGWLWQRLGLSPAVYCAAALTIITLPIHRGALLFVAFAAAIFLALYILSIIYARFGTRALRWVALTNVAILALVGGMSLKVVFFPSDGGMDEWGFWDLFDLVLRPLTGKSLANVAIDGDLAPGAGARVALFEIARSMSLLAFSLVMLGSLVLAFLALRSRERIDAILAPAERDRAFFFAAQTLIFAVLLAAILTGFPFIHRAGFVEALLLSTALATLAALVLPRLPTLTIPSFALGAGCVAIVGLALFAAPANVAPYFNRAGPVLIALALLSVVAPLAARMSRAVALVPLLAIVSAVGVEIAVSRTYFKPYAFQNQTPPESGPLAAYDRADLAAAEAVLKHMEGDEILVSDPKNITFLRSRTGLYPVVSVSNLDTMESGAKRSLERVLELAIRGGSSDAFCAELQRMTDGGASAVYNYANIRRLSPRVSGVDALRMLGYDNRLVPRYQGSVAQEPTAREATAREPARPTAGPPLPWTSPVATNPKTFLVNISSATLVWLESPDALQYFPTEEQLPQDIVANLSGMFPEHYSYYGRFFGLVSCA